MLKHADLFCYRGLVWQDVRTVCLCWLIDSESRKLIVATLATHTHTDYRSIRSRSHPVNKTSCNCNHICVASAPRAISIANK